MSKTQSIIYWAGNGPYTAKVTHGAKATRAVYTKVTTGFWCQQGMGRFVRDTDLPSFDVVCIENPTTGQWQRRPPAK
jgi:hypothetical protein